MVIVVMLGALVAMRRRSVSHTDTPAPVPLGRRLRRFMSDQPLGTLDYPADRAHCPAAGSSAGYRQRPLDRQHDKVCAFLLAILAGCQTLTMLTGGIDLSVGTVATMSAFIVAPLA